MDLRIYMKSGNNYYIDVSEYEYDYMLNLLQDSISYKDTLAIDTKGKTYFILCADIEYFELDIPDYIERIPKGKIGFNY